MKVLPGFILAAVGTVHTAQAALVQVNGSFNDQSATSNYFFNRTYNQDNVTSPSKPIPSNLGMGTDSVAYFGWGIDVTDSIITGEIIQSHFGFNGTGSVAGGAEALALNGEAFSLGSFRYTNEQTNLSGGYVEVDFQMDLTIDGVSLLPIEYRIGIENTPNLESPDYDTATLTGTPADSSFWIGDTNYLLSFNGFSRDGGINFETTADLAEGFQTSAEIYATLTVASVPVPAAVWLFGSGLIGLVGFAKRRRNI